ncbi:MAG: hypothetical protein HOD60_06775 [Candidatus Nitrosopelagicus sp.]|nr:hypothetical protein [Candidatus Nitrosopelagicus sp.]
MSLVTDVFDYVKTNPGTDGINLQNHFSNDNVSDALSNLESTNAIRWTNQGYVIIKQSVIDMRLSLDDLIEDVEEIIKEQILKTCPKCNINTKGKQNIEEIFGYRKCSGKVIPQSYCRKCRCNKMQGKIITTGNKTVSYGSGYLKWKSKQKQRKPQFVRQEIKNNAAKTSVDLKEERERTLSFEDHFKNSIIDSNDNVLQYMTRSSDATKRDDFKF